MYSSKETTALKPGVAGWNLVINTNCTAPLPSWVCCLSKVLKKLPPSGVPAFIQAAKRRKKLSPLNYVFIRGKKPTGNRSFTDISVKYKLSAVSQQAWRGP